MDTLEAQVQRLGRLRARRQRIEAEEQRLTSAVRSRMAEHGRQVVRSDDFEARLANRQTLTVDPAAFARAVTKRDLLASVTVSVQAARALLGDVKLRKISTATESVQLRVSARTTDNTDAEQPAEVAEDSAAAP